MATILLCLRMNDSPFTTRFAWCHLADGYRRIAMCAALHQKLQYLGVHQEAKPVSSSNRRNISDGTADDVDQEAA